MAMATRPFPKLNDKDPSGMLRYELGAARSAEEVINIYVREARNYVLKYNITDPVAIDRVVEAAMNAANMRLKELGGKWIVDSENKAIIRSNIMIEKMGHTSIILGPIGLPPEITRRLAVIVMNDVNSLTQDVRKNVSNALIEGMNAGEGARKLGKRVQEATDVDRARARTIARTTVMKTLNTTNAEAYKEAGATGYVLYPTEDERLCKQCKEKAFENGISGDLKVYTYDQIISIFPVHPNCRCTVEGTWKDIQTPSFAPMRGNIITFQEGSIGAE